MEKNQPCVPAFVSNESKIKKSADECRGKNVLFSVMPEEALVWPVLRI